MTHEYESLNVPGLYFAGALSHGKDYRRAAGGFIHGFRFVRFSRNATAEITVTTFMLYWRSLKGRCARHLRIIFAMPRRVRLFHVSITLAPRLRYTARALSRILDEKYFETRWPSTLFVDLNDWLHLDLQTLRADPPCDHDGVPSNSVQSSRCVSSVLTVGLDSLLDRIFRRVDTASGPYQMVSVLGDGAVFECTGGGLNKDGSRRNVTAKYDLCDLCRLSLCVASVTCM